LLTKRKLNIRTPCRTSLSVTAVKTPFLSSLLISLYYKSIKGAFCTRTNISIGGGCLIDVLVEVRWFSIMGFLVIGCFWGYSRPRFTVGLAGLVSLWGTSRVGKGASSLSSLVGASSLSSLTL
jgi:hypothetical protein